MREVESAFRGPGLYNFGHAGVDDTVGELTLRYTSNF